MLRRAVAISMAFVLTAGQGLCCCSVVSLARRPSPPAAGERPAPPARPCCPGCCAAVSSSATHDRPAAAGQQPDQEPVEHRCPCQGKHKPQATAGEAAGGSAVQQAARLLALAVEFVAVTSGCDGPHHPLVDTGGGTSPPGHRLVARHLLDRHHLLRC